MTSEEVADTLMNRIPSEIPISVFVHAAELIQSREHTVDEERERNKKYRDLARWCVEHSWEGNDVCGGSLQEKATELGVLTETKMDGPCGDENTECNCEQSDGVFPLYCYRWKEDA